MSVAIPLAIVFGLGIGLFAAAMALHWIGMDEDDTQDDKPDERTGLYDWSGNPTEDQYRVLVDLSDDGRQAL